MYSDCTLYIIGYLYSSWDIRERERESEKGREGEGEGVGEGERGRGGEEQTETEMETETETDRQTESVIETFAHRSHAEGHGFNWSTKLL